MPKITDYAIVAREDRRELAVGVNEAITQGYQPFGAVVIHATNDRQTNQVYLLYHQAMVKYETED